MVRGQYSVAEIERLNAEWDYEKNDPIKPEDVSWKSSHSYWWRCEKGHSWRAQPANRMNNTGCPYCAGKKAWPGFNDLATTNPQIASEWDYKRNGSTTPQEVTPHSNKYFWWKCDKGHVWKAQVNNRTNGYGCPYCSGRYSIKGETDLLTVFPFLAVEWDYKKNYPLTPNQVSAKSNKKIWWLCKEGHSWQEAPAKRSRGDACPYCSGHRVLIGFIDLATVAPEIALEWNYEKNKQLRPDQVTSNSNKKVWWKCANGHEWTTTVSHRVGQGTGCPFCSGRYPIKGKTDLETVNPLLAKEWDYSKNGILKPSDVSPNSEKDVWWKCTVCGHIWKAKPAARNSRMSGCPKCGRRSKTSFPEQALFFYIQQELPDAQNSYKEIFDNGMELDIYLPSIRTGIEYDGNFHEGKRADEKKYNICRHNNIKLIRVSEIDRDNKIDLCDIFIHSKYLIPQDGGIDSTIKEVFNLLDLRVPDTTVDIQRDRNIIYSRYLSRLRNNSLSINYPDVAKEWNYDKNGSLTPDMFDWGASIKVWWKCSQCGNEWQASIASRTSNGTGCPLCSRKIVKEGQIKARLRNRENALATSNPELVEEWDFEKNTNIDISKITKSSNEKVWWRCKSRHSWKTTVSSRTGKSKTGCPYCNSRKVLPGFNDLATINPEVANLWCYEKNGELTPEQLLSHSNRKVWWKCEQGHTWEAVVSSVTSGHRCPYCSGKAVLSGFNDFQTRQPKLAEEWDYIKNGALSPTMITEHSGKRV